jgi:hypothetical protein
MDVVAPHVAVMAGRRLQAYGYLIAHAGGVLPSFMTPMKYM